MDLNETIQATWDKVGGWLAGAIQALPNLIVALLVLVIFFYGSRYVRRLTYRLLGRVSQYRAVNRLLSTVAFVALLGLGLVVALTILNLGTAVASLLGAAGILGLAIGFAAQDSVENLIAGVMISIRRPLREGDLVETNDTFGVVDQVNLRNTVVRQPAGQLVYVPNSSVFKNRLVNYSSTGQRRVDIECGVSYGDDLEKAKRVALEAIEGLEERIPGRDVEFYYKEFGGSSINFVLRFWIAFGRSQTDFLAAQSGAVIALKRAFDDNDITIPFPIRTLDFGILGGVPLREELDGAELATGTRDQDRLR